MDKPSFEESLRELLARRLAAEGHPTPEALAAYRASELTTAQHERIKDHLAICEECSRLLHELTAFEHFEPARESIAPVDVQAEASWQHLRERLNEEGGELERAEEARAAEAIPAFVPPSLRRRMPLWRRPALPWALAAGLALCVAGLGWRTGSLGRQIAELSKPQAVRVVTLESEEDSTRGSEDEAPVRAGERVYYDLPLSRDPDAPIYPLYEVKIVPAAGDAAPIPAGRQPADDRFLRVLVPAAPEPGDYVFEISGIAEDQEVPVGRYPFTVLPAP